jgi:hypothetical protein
VNRRALARLACIAAVLVPTARAEDRPQRPVFAGEALEYEMSWGIFKGGIMSIDTTDEIEYEGRPAYRIELSAISNDFISTFFVVRDSITSWIDARTLQSLRYEKHTVEGKRVRDERIEFDLEADVARREGRTIPFVPPVFDSLSAVYYLRTQPLSIGKDIEFTVVSGKRAYTLVVDVTRREQVATPAGVFDTVLVHPRMKEEGLLKKGGDLWIWFTDDDRRIPVVIRSKLNFGTLTARLRKRSETEPSEGAGR